MMKTAIVGASGYTGAELARLLARHPDFELCDLFVSSHSQDAGRKLSELYGRLQGEVDLPLQPLNDNTLKALSGQYDAIFLATPHQASHDWMPELSGGRAVIFDLSGAFRIKDKQVFSEYYGFDHQHGELLDQAVYGLADWHQQGISKAALIAVPGCYPTASLTALKPLQESGLLDAGQWPVINAISGVSGAGRKASLNSSFCEVSLQPYGVLGHRHQPEISAELGAPVIFTPHLGNFKRGILATITVKVAPGIDPEQIDQAYLRAYADNPLVRLRQTWPKIDEVAGSCYCDVFWKLDPASGHLVVVSAIDNLLKGAAAQALQCANLRFDFQPQTALTEESVCNH
ncbi:N-acetyl-gamma-glutamyl-phosphate reductase [Lacimicrobium alkaliphilum]|uniref:N-acetyl-gamma-glutamyl-phosphate reductase n=1 Tax=Lacimicrobium alkaliphilum TaxID=1526571 RepID=A0ABQ1RKL4_9ALTE|nr:N-acetyl-gamma-glutamyl-phosphate reductase [Lacimicrobium alkaliphilum]GGD73708.1 N-acetyl-gamma-glutamyl-phosphate reductase [Lacimicrobium alkaliphilum]